MLGELFWKRLISEARGARNPLPAPIIPPPPLPPSPLMASGIVRNMFTRAGKEGGVGVMGLDVRGNEVGGGPIF